jgi:hypothetical protein
MKYKGFFPTIYERSRIYAYPHCLKTCNGQETSYFSLLPIVDHFEFEHIRLYQLRTLNDIVEFNCY